MSPRSASSCAGSSKSPIVIKLDEPQLEGVGDTLVFVADRAFIDAPALARRFLRRRLPGVVLREHSFEPTFHKHAGLLCSGLQVHVDDPAYDHAVFRPWRLQALAFKALRQLRPDYPLWRDFAYEYEHGRLAIDLINGSDLLRRWVDDDAAEPGDLEALARRDEQAWLEERSAGLLYR